MTILKGSGDLGVAVVRWPHSPLSNSTTELMVVMTPFLIDNCKAIQLFTSQVSGFC